MKRTRPSFSAPGRSGSSPSRPGPGVPLLRPKRTAEEIAQMRADHAPEQALRDARVAQKGVEQERIQATLAEATRLSEARLSEARSSEVSSEVAQVKD